MEVMEISDPGLLARARQALTVPLQQALGAALLDPGDPAAGVRFEIGELAGDGGGGLHADALNVIVELAGYLAVLPVLADHEHAVTDAISTQLFASARRGDRVTVSGTLDRRTGRLAFVSVLASVEEHTIARSQLTKSIVQRA